MANLEREIREERPRRRLATRCSTSSTSCVAVKEDEDWQGENLKLSVDRARLLVQRSLAANRN